MTDHQLIEQTKKGELSAFSTLVERYHSLIAATVIGMLGKCSEAEDVGQETFIRFYKNLNNFQGKSSVGTYITRIAINLSLNEIKRQKKRRLLSLYDNENKLNLELADNRSQNEIEESKEIVQKSIQKLEPEFRSVVVLRLIDGYSTKETADMLNLPLGTVLSRLARAQKKLKVLLKPYVGEYHESKVT